MHKSTPGPWRWHGSASNSEVYLATDHSGRRYVMGFKRWGMRGAQPMFQPAGRGMVPASDLLKFEVGERAIVGYEAAKADGSVYRYNISGIDCADACLIAAAPCLLAALESAVEAYGKPGGPWNVPSDPGGWLDQARAAIAKAKCA